MHAYSIDRDLRTKIAVGIFIVSMAMTLLMEMVFLDILQQVSYCLEASKFRSLYKLIQWLDLFPDIMGIPIWYGIFSLVYEHYVWKCRLARKLHKIPNLNGIWTGELLSSYADEPIPIKMEIKQAWSKISFKSTFSKADSESYSNVAAIYVDGNQGTVISFAFRNNGYNVKDGLPSYDGYNILMLSDPNKIKARYFNNRPNQDPTIKGGNKGSFEIERVSMKFNNLTTDNFQQE